MKILVFNTYELKPIGGPSGYLYNLKKYYENLKLKDIDISFLNFKEEKNFNIFERIILKFLFLLKLYNIYALVLYYCITKKMKKIINFDDYDIVHFHTTLELKRNILNLKNYKGKVILTSHSPELSSEEYLKNLGIKLREEIYNLYKKYDYDAFERADYIIFPCFEAMEPYKKDPTTFTILQNKKIKFLPTGIISENIKKESNYFFRNYQIPQDAFVISFVGRHNKIKGYDIAKEFAEKILKEYKDIYFIIAGKESKEISPLKDSHWIEVGWTEEGKKIIKNSQLYILPNRETYFDLVFLEALSLNSSILCSYTGGNKYFKKYNSSNIIFFSNIEEMIVSFKSFYEWKKENLDNKENEKIFKDNFTIEIFYENYISILKEIQNEK